MCRYQHDQHHCRPPTSMSMIMLILISTLPYRFRPRKHGRSSRPYCSSRTSCASSTVVYRVWCTYLWIPFPNTSQAVAVNTTNYNGSIYKRTVRKESKVMLTESTNSNISSNSRCGGYHCPEVLPYSFPSSNFWCGAMCIVESLLIRVCTSFESRDVPAILGMNRQWAFRS